MSSPLVLLAQLEGLNPLNPGAPVGKSTGFLFRDMMVIIVTGVVLALPLILWARYYVKTRKRRRHHHHFERAAETPAAPAETDEEENGDEPGRRHRRRRRRRDHRLRNPTLAETGGLPPAKPEGPSAPSL